MLINKKVDVSTGKPRKVVGQCTIPQDPETIQDAIKVLNDDSSGLSCLKNGLTIHYQGMLRNQFALRSTKPSQAKLDLIAKAKKYGYYEVSFEGMNVKSITDNLLEKLASIKGKK